MSGTHAEAHTHSLNVIIADERVKRRRGEGLWRWKKSDKIEHFLETNSPKLLARLYYNMLWLSGELFRVKKARTMASQCCVCDGVGKATRLCFRFAYKLFATVFSINPASIRKIKKMVIYWSPYPHLLLFLHTILPSAAEEIVQCVCVWCCAYLANKHITPIPNPRRVHIFPILVYAFTKH